MLTPIPVSLVCLSQPQSQWYVDASSSLNGMLIKFLASNPNTSHNGMSTSTPVSMVCQSQPQSQWYANPNPSMLPPIRVSLVCLSQP